jgi:hypothetical protein
MTKGKIQWDKQRSTKQTHKTKDRVTRTPLKPKGLKGSGRVSNLCSTGGTRHGNLVTNPVLNETNIIWYGNRIGHQYTLVNTNKTWTPYKRNGSQVESNIVFSAEIVADITTQCIEWPCENNINADWFDFVGIEHHTMLINSFSQQNSIMFIFSK